MARNRWYNDFYHFPKSVPLAVAGGIKAQTKQGAFGKSWWAKRWIGILESFNLGARLGRGRSYARRGQVVSIDIEPGMVSASVQGSRRLPYNVKIKVKTLSQQDCKTLVRGLSRQAIFAAKLLANEMPQDIETLFQENNLSLFPTKLRDLKTDCSCPDWSNPCKHVAAVYYLIGEEFDRDPFLIFKLRGLDREKLIGLLSALPEKAEATRSRRKHAKGRVQILAPESVAVGEDERLGPGACAPALSGVTGEPISAELASFWQGTDLSAELSLEAQAPPVAAPLVKRLGSVPFWRSNRRFVDTFELIYQRASRQAMKVLVGESLSTKK